MEVVKQLHPWTKYAAATGVGFEHLQAVYAATAGAQGVVHAAEGPAPPQDTGDRYKVTLWPVGRLYESAIPVEEEDLRVAAHGLLHGLDALHKVCACHRPAGLLVCLPALLAMMWSSHDLHMLACT